MKRLALIAAVLASTAPAWGAAPGDLSLLSGPVPAQPVIQWLAGGDGSSAAWID